MSDPVRLQRTLQLAIHAFLSTPGRRGRRIDLRDAGDVMVAGDLHGNLENFRRLLDRAALAAHPRRHLVFQELVHGPFRYPTGGDKSHQALDLIATLKCRYSRQVHMLLGNHELSQATGQWVAKADDDLNALFREGVDTAYGDQAEAIYGLYRNLFAVLPLAVACPNRIFLSHSLPNSRRLATFDPAVLERFPSPAEELQPGGSVHAMVWGRDTSRETAAEFLRKVDADLLITGHIPCADGFMAPNDRQIILDAAGAPACCCLFPTDRALTHAELVSCVQVLS